MRSLLRSVSFLSLIQIVTYVVPLLVLTHIVKTVGPYNYGILAFAQGLSIFFHVTLDFGFGLAATQKISQMRQNFSFISELISAILIIKSVIFLFIIVILIIIKIIYGMTNFNFIIIFLLLSFFMSLMPDFYFIGTNKLKYFSFISILSKVLYAILIIIYVEDKKDYILVPVIGIICQIALLALCSFYLTLQGFRFKFPKASSVRYAIKIGRGFFVSRVAVASYMNLGIVALGFASSPASVAVYSVAEQMYKAMQAALAPIAQSLYSYMSKEKDINLMTKVGPAVVLLVAVVAFIVSQNAEIILSVLFDERYLSAIPILNIFLIAIVVHAAAVLAGYPLASALGKIHVANKSVITGALIYFVILFFLILFDNSSAYYLAILMIVAELAVLIHRLYMLVPLIIEFYDFQRKSRL